PDDEPLKLLHERGDEARMPVAEARDGDTGEEIQVLVAVDVDERAAATRFERQLGELRNALEPGRDPLLLGRVHRARPGARPRPRALPSRWRLSGTRPHRWAAPPCASKRVAIALAAAGRHAAYLGQSCP